MCMRVQTFRARLRVYARSGVTVHVFLMRPSRGGARRGARAYTRFIKINAGLCNLRIDDSMLSARSCCSAGGDGGTGEMG